MWVRVLGPLEVCGDAGPMVLAGASQRTVLALLALHAGHPVGLPVLIDALWPDEPPPSARNSLQSHVARLRAALGTPGVIALDPAGYRLAVGRDRVDALHFEDLLRADATVADALALWRGAPLPEFPGEPFRGIAARLTGLYRDALVVVGDEALDRLAAAVRADPCWERGVVALAAGLVRGGKRDEAIAVLRRHAEAVVGELGLDPSDAVRQLQAAILRGDLGPGRAADRGGRADVVPLRFSSFLGREREGRQLAAMLSEPGLVTVTGAGGVGKTRLVAETVPACGRIAWVDGADVAEADFVDAVAVAVGVRLGPLDDALLLIGRAAAGFDVVVLDNCEHLLGAAVRVVAALRSVRVVVTSQERLRADGERVLALQPLDAAAAARLFRERGGADGSEQAVDEIVRRLDLLPLAIELAATQAAALGVEELRDRLDDRLDLLVRGNRDGAGRHQTLRAVVEWSFGLLDDTARVALRRLAVFAGAFTASQAEAVAGDPAASTADVGAAGGDAAVPRPVGGPLPRARVAAVLAALVDRSLVVRHGVGRFRLLETVRAFAAEGDQSAAERRHAAAMVAAAEMLDDEMHGPEQAAAVREVDALLPDLRLAFARGSQDVRIRLAAALYRYGYHCQHYEVLRWGRAAIGAEHHPRAPGALAAAATHAWGRGELAEARALADAALPPGAPAHEVLGDVALVICDGPAAINHYRAMEGSPAAKVSGLIGEALVLAWSGHATEAARKAHQAMEISDLSGNPSARAEARYGLGEALGDTEPERALALLAEAAEIAADADDRLFAAAAGTAAVAIRSRHGDPRSALASFRDVLALWRQAGNDTLHAAALRNLVVLLVRVGEDEAAVLVDAALPPAGVYPAESARLDRARRAAAERLGDERVITLRDIGATLSPARVTDEASRAIDAALARLSG